VSGKIGILFSQMDFLHLQVCEADQRGEEHAHVTDEHRKRAGIKSLSKRCSFCRKPLSAYPLIMNDDAGFHVFHAACAATLATDIIVDLSTFFHPPAPYHQFFVLTTGEAACNDEPGGTDGINRS